MTSTPHDIEGRLAALELIAGIAFKAWATQMYASGHPTRTPKILERIKAGIDDGSFPAPADPKARDAMKATLDAIFDAPAFPPGNWVQEIEKELFPDRTA
ncbi:hypothetical protein [Azospirillum sp. TSO22-1]|uniref:hypothetical protein n=1 Tax=Azospirillum sp. TSO22-1 TaxID=716789 RepID=UPI000D621FFD|nr:hypothetical protein [Azospirillum sp. TSO22-1]PWC53621.1 hypothetical protein TSO221_10360 [Azospirillum sp. TSO22-1]